MAPLTADVSAGAEGNAGAQFTTLPPGRPVTNRTYFLPLTTNTRASPTAMPAALASVALLVVAAASLIVVARVRLCTDPNAALNTGAHSGSVLSVPDGRTRPTSDP